MLLAVVGSGVGGVDAAGHAGRVGNVAAWTVEVLLVKRKLLDGSTGILLIGQPRTAGVLAAFLQPPLLNWATACANGRLPVTTMASVTG